MRAIICCGQLIYELVERPEVRITRQYSHCAPFSLHVWVQDNSSDIDNGFRDRKLNAHGMLNLLLFGRVPARLLVR